MGGMKFVLGAGVWCLSGLSSKKNSFGPPMLYIGVSVIGMISSLERKNFFMSEIWVIASNSSSDSRPAFLKLLRPSASLEFDWIDLKLLYLFLQSVWKMKLKFHKSLLRGMSSASCSVIVEWSFLTRTGPPMLRKVYNSISKNHRQA